MSPVRTLGITPHPLPEFAVIHSAFAGKMLGQTGPIKSGIRSYFPCARISAKNMGSPAMKQAEIASHSNMGSCRPDCRERDSGSTVDMSRSGDVARESHLH